MNSPFARYVTHVGGRAKAAERLEISRSMVDHLVSGIRTVSAKVALKLVSDPENPGVTLHQLRNDIWQRPDDKPADKPADRQIERVAA